MSVGELQHKAAQKQATSMNLEPLDEESGGGQKTSEELFTVHWADEESGQKIIVPVEVQAHSIVLDVILAALGSLNEKLGKEHRQLGFLLQRDPNLYSLMLADEDLEPEEPAFENRQSFKSINFGTIRDLCLVENDTAVTRLSKKTGSMISPSTSPKKPHKGSDSDQPSKQETSSWCSRCCKKKTPSDKSVASNVSISEPLLSGRHPSSN